MVKNICPICKQDMGEPCEVGTICTTHNCPVNDDADLWFIDSLGRPQRKQGHFKYTDITFKSVRETELEAQIEKMKCCTNCKHDYFGDRKNLPHCNKCSDNSEWELR